MILIGSRALAQYGLSRKCVDWDFIGTESELASLKKQAQHYISKEYSTILKIDNHIVEFSLYKEVDDLIKINCRVSKFDLSISIPTIPSLLAIKEATADFLNREKHFEDINWIYEKFPDIRRDEDLYHAKRTEIANRIAEATENKYQFFHKYHDVEKIEHDKLHDMIAELLFEGYPTYKLFVEGDVEVSEEAWNRLPEVMKLRRFIEETLVLTFERWYIPKLLKKGIYNPHTKKKFVMMSGVLAEHVLRGLKDEDPFMSQWGRDNRDKVLLGVKAAASSLVTTKELPKWFYETLMRMRFNEG